MRRRVLTIYAIALVGVMTAVGIGAVLGVRHRARLHPHRSYSLLATLGPAILTTLVGATVLSLQARSVLRRFQSPVAEAWLAVRRELPRAERRRLGRLVRNQQSLPPELRAAGLRLADYLEQTTDRFWRRPPWHLWAGGVGLLLSTVLNGVQAGSSNREHRLHLIVAALSGGTLVYGAVSFAAMRAYLLRHTARARRAADDSADQL